MLEKLLNELEILKKQEKSALDKFDVSKALELTLRIRDTQAEVIHLLLKKEKKNSIVH